jgi:hypothetical protein
MIAELGCGVYLVGSRLQGSRKQCLSTLDGVTLSMSTAFRLNDTDQLSIGNSFCSDDVSHGLPLVHAGLHRRFIER